MTTKVYRTRAASARLGGSCCHVTTEQLVLPFCRWSSYRFNDTLRTILDHEVGNTPSPPPALQFPASNTLPVLQSHVSVAWQAGSACMKRLIQLFIWLSLANTAQAHRS